MEVGDGGVFFVGEVVPAVADVRELGVDEFFEDVAVEEDVAGSLDVEGLCVSRGMLGYRGMEMGSPVDVGVSRTRRDPGSREMSGGGMLLRGNTMACGRSPWQIRPVLRRWSSGGSAMSSARGHRRQREPCPEHNRQPNASRCIR